jgi:phosphate acetyltransferase
LPEGNDDRIIMAASRLIEMDVVDFDHWQQETESKVAELGLFF